MIKNSNNGNPFLCPQTGVGTASGLVWPAAYDVPDTLLDQQVDAAHPYTNGRWESIFFQVQEVGKTGSLRWQICASVDQSNWSIIAGPQLVNPTEPLNITAEENVYNDLGPGRVAEFILTNKGDDLLLAFRYFKLQALSPSNNPNQKAKILAIIYAR